MHVGPRHPSLMLHARVASFGGFVLAWLGRVLGPAEVGDAYIGELDVPKLLYRVIGYRVELSRCMAPGLCSIGFVESQGPDCTAYQTATARGSVTSSRQ